MTSGEPTSASGDAGGFWRLRHRELEAALSRRDLPGEQLRVYLALADLTRGFGKNEDAVSLGMIGKRAGGMRRSRVADTLKKLAAKNLYEQEDGEHGEVIRRVIWPAPGVPVAGNTPAGVPKGGNTPVPTQGNTSVPKAGSRGVPKAGNLQEGIKNLKKRKTGARAAQKSPRAGKDTEGFDRFWSVYPRKVAKPKARLAWAKAIRERDFPGIEALLAAVERHKASDQWQRDDGRYIPYPASWLNGQRWSDELPAAGSDAGLIWEDRPMTPDLMAVAFSVPLPVAQIMHDRECGAGEAAAILAGDMELAAREHEREQAELAKQVAWAREHSR